MLKKHTIKDIEKLISLANEIKKDMVSTTNEPKSFSFTAKLIKVFETVLLTANKVNPTNTVNLFNSTAVQSAFNGDAFKFKYCLNFLEDMNFIELLDIDNDDDKYCEYIEYPFNVCIVKVTEDGKSFLQEALAIMPKTYIPAQYNQNGTITIHVNDPAYVHYFDY